MSYRIEQFVHYTENNGIFRVTVECLLSSGIKTHGRSLFSFIDLFPPYFIKLCLNIHPKIPLKCDLSIWAGPNPFTFWSANFQIKLAPLILYTTLVYFYFKIYSLKNISNFRYSNKKIITFYHPSFIYIHVDCALVSLKIKLCCIYRKTTKSY